MDLTRPDVGFLLGMFCEDPIMPHDDKGEPREIKRKELDKAKLVDNEAELDSLKKEVYARWGVVVEPKKSKAVELFDTMVELVPQALAEQRDRLLDLLDRIVGAIIEDSCPLNRPPDDWDWNAIFEGFEQHFGVELDDAIADYGDREALACELYEIAAKAYQVREDEIGLELILRIFRHIYLEELDRVWVDHLTNMDHLRDGIGLRGYGQKDPKQEYKREGYNMFITMLASVSSSVVLKLMSAQISKDEDEEAIEAADLARHQERLAGAWATHGGDVLPASSSPGLLSDEPLIEPDMECPCGSGEPFSSCHGAET